MHPADQTRRGVSTTAQGDVVAQGIFFLGDLSMDTVLGDEIRKRAASARDDLKKTAEEQRLRLAVLGETSSGKSTFINALLDVDLLASDLEPTTAVSTRLTFGPAFQVEVTRGEQVERLWNRRHIDVEAVRAALDCVRSPNSALLDYDGGLLSNRRPAVVEFIKNATTEGGDGQNVDDVTIRLPSRYLAAAIDILDTPGFNPGLAEADQRRHLAVTRRSIESSHLALFLIDARNPLKSTEERFLREFGPSLSRVFFVANKMDLLDADEAADTEDYIRGELAAKFGFPAEEVTIYFVSSVRPAADESSRYSDALERLRSDVVAFMQKSRTALVMDRAARTFAEQAEGLQLHAESLAEDYRVRLEQLHSRQITDVAQMQEIVSEAVERAYQQAVAHAAAAFGGAIERQMTAAIYSFQSDIGCIKDRTKVETAAYAYSESNFSGEFKLPLEQALLNELTKAIDR